MSQLPEPFGYIYDGDPTGVKFTRELTKFQELLCSTAPVFSLSQLQAYVEQTIAYKEAEILRLHAQLAGQTLRADQGWARYEAANKGRLERDQLASVKREPLSIAALRLIETLQVFNNKATLIDFARAIEAAHGIGKTK